MRAKFHGRNYKVKVGRLDEAWGICHDSTDKKQSLGFDPKLFKKKTRFVLEILCHEALHAIYEDLSEDAVEKGARDLSKFLHKMGVRVPVKTIIKQFRKGVGERVIV